MNKTSTVRPLATCRSKGFFIPSLSICTTRFRVSKNSFYGDPCTIRFLFKFRSVSTLQKYFTDGSVNKQTWIWLRMVGSFPKLNYLEILPLYLITLRTKKRINNQIVTRIIPCIKEATKSYWETKKKRNPVRKIWTPCIHRLINSRKVKALICPIQKFIARLVALGLYHQIKLEKPELFFRQSCYFL